MSKNKLASIPGKPLPERQTNFLSKLLDEPIGAIERWGHRGAQMRQQGLDLINQSLDPNVGQLQGLGMAGLGAAMIPASPFLSLLPSSQELRDRGRAAGGGELNQAIGGAIGDLVNIPDPATSATALATLGKAALSAKGLAAAAPILGKSAMVAPLGKGLAELMAEASPAEQLALKARLEAEAGQVGGDVSNVSREQALQGLTGADTIPAMKNIIDPKESLRTVIDSNYTGPTKTERKMVPIDELNGSMSGAADDHARVKDLAGKMSADGGYFERLIVDGNTGDVVEGQHRLNAARQLGLKHVPVVAIYDATHGLPVADMEAAVRATRKMPSDHVNQIISRVAEAIAEEGSAAKVRASYDAPRGFEDVWKAALDAVSAKEN